MLAAFALGPSTCAADLVLTKHTIDANFEKGYQISVADIDADGRPDVIALSTNPSRLVWYKNPGWERFTITLRTSNNIDVAPHDIDGDGDPDLALASEFYLSESTRGGLIHWLECPDDPAANQDWALHEIDAVPTSHRLRWADVTGDGRVELVNLPIVGVGAQAPDYAVGVQMKAYRFPAKPSEETWQTLLIDDTLQMAHGLCPVQWDGDAPAELLTASFGGVYLHEFQSGEPVFAKRRLGAGHEGERPKRGSSEVGFGVLGAENGRFIAAIEPWHGHEVVVYAPDGDEQNEWRREVIDNSFNDGHALACADLDGDKADEIIAGHRGPGHNLYIYRYDAVSAGWRRLPLDTGGMAAAGLYIADLNQDTRVDIVAIGTATNNVAWYENLGPAGED